MGNDGETDFPAGISVIRSRSRRHPPRRDRTARRKQPGDAHQDKEPFRAAAFHAGEINPALPDRRRLQQMYSAKDPYRRGDREDPRQGDPSQDPGPEPDTGGGLGDEQRVTETTGRRQLPALNGEQAASNSP